MAMAFLTLSELMKIQFLRPIVTFLTTRWAVLLLSSSFPFLMYGRTFGIRPWGKRIVCTSGDLAEILGSYVSKQASKLSKSGFARYCRSIIHSSAFFTTYFFPLSMEFRDLPDRFNCDSSYLGHEYIDKLTPARGHAYHLEIIVAHLSHPKHDAENLLNRPYQIIS